MSDGLIERLEELKSKASKADWQIRFGGKEEDDGFCIASRIENNVVCERWPALGATEYNYHDPQLILTLVNNLDEIIAGLSTLKTVRGIEGLAKESGGVSIEYSPAWPDDENKVWHVGVDLVGYTRETLSLAVDAAVGAKKQ